MTVLDMSYWYAMRVTYSREMVVKRYCDANEIDNFVPMAYKFEEKNGAVVKKLEPVVRNLIFIKSPRHYINELKLRFPLRYIMDHCTDHPMIVPEKQMQNFMTVANRCDQPIVYLDANELNSKIGTRVRINAGVFKGVEGKLVKVRNNKRVVVQIEGLVIVATHYIHPSYLECLD